MDIPEDAEKRRILSELAAYACEGYHFCASVGCGCLTESGDTVCSEHEVQGVYFPHVVSEGPTWSFLGVGLARSIRVELYFTGPVLGDESLWFYQKLQSYQKPLFLAPGASTGDL